MTNLKRVVIYSGYNTRAVIAFCRFAEKNSIPVSILASGEEDKIFKTSYSRHVVAVRKFQHLDFDTIKNEVSLIKKNFKSNEIFILPSSEYLNRVLIEEKERFNEQGVDFGLCEKNLYKKISDKQAFGELCRSYDILVPETLKNVPDSGPFVIKPESYRNSDGDIIKPVIINNWKDREENRKLMNCGDTFIQEYIDGRSFYLLCYFSKDGKTHQIYSQENLLQQGNGGSILLAKTSDVHREPVTDKFIKMFTGQGFSGLVMVELKLFDGFFYLIEANPRLWGPSQLILDAGMNLFDSFARDNNLLTGGVTKNNYTPAWYYWHGGIIEDQTRSRNLSFHQFSKSDFFDHMYDFSQYDIYCREDTSVLHKYESEFRS